LDILDRPLRLGQGLRILSRPCLELVEQGFGPSPIDFRLMLKGGFESGGQFIAQLAFRQGVDAGD
jgi:hypothetical protein